MSQNHTIISWNADNADSEKIDTDDDGILDTHDIDDDNDGALDSGDIDDDNDGVIDLSNKLMN